MAVIDKHVTFEDRTETEIWLYDQHLIEYEKGRSNDNNVFFSTTLINRYSGKLLRNTVGCAIHYSGFEKSEFSKQWLNS